MGGNNSKRRFFGLFNREKDNAENTASEINETPLESNFGVINEEEVHSEVTNDTDNESMEQTNQKEYPTNHEFLYIDKLIRFRLNTYFPDKSDKSKPKTPDSKTWSVFIPEIINDYLADIEEQEREYAKALLLLTLVPHVIPDLLDIVIKDKIGDNGDFQRIGGVRGKNFRGFIPTCETALFLLAGDSPEERIQVQRLLESESFLIKNQVIRIEDPPVGEPMLSGMIIMEQEYVELFTTGAISRPRFGFNFPAQLLETPLEWSDLVLPAETLKQIEDLNIWIEHNSRLKEKWKVGKKLKSGLRVLFHGPPGTGKTMTASLLGKTNGRDVYKIDLSLVVSKYIGETEKNLGKLFDKAKNKDWILFFDEADALFGKRTNIRDAHDKYANQEVSYLLQRVEDYPGLVILATNYKGNIDEAFSRRFQGYIYFPPPKKHDRIRLWNTYLPEPESDDEHIDVHGIAKRYNLNGGNIVNVVQYACLQALHKNLDYPEEADLLYGIQREYSKEGKIF